MVVNHMKIKAIFISEGLSPGPHRKGPPYLYSESHFLEFIKYDSMEDDFFKLNLNIVENIDNISVNEKYKVYYDCNQFYEGIKKILKSDKKVFQRIVRDLQQDRCKLIIHNSDTTPARYDDFDEEGLYFLVEQNNISFNNIVLILQEIVLNENKNKLEKLRFPIVFFNILSADILRDCYRHDLIKCFEPLFECSKYSYRDNHFISFNNNIKQHRIDLLNFLVENKIINKGMTSWFAGNEPIDQGRDGMEWSENIKPWIGYSPDLKVYEYRQDWLNPIPHFNSYFNIITESNWGQFGYDEHKVQKIFFSEKTWKSILTFQPFVLISTRHSLKKLRELGFKTFSPFIDESYDKIETYEQRKELINNEIIKLCNKTKLEIDEWYWKMKDILIHNHNHFFNFVNLEYKKLKNLVV